MIKRLAAKTWGEFLETGKTAARQSKQLSPGKIVKTAMEQLSSSHGSNPPPGLEDLTAKKVSQNQLQQMKQNDAVKRSQGLSSTRLLLQKMIIQRYQQMQESMLRKEQENEKDKRQKEKEEIEAIRKKELKEKKQPQAVVLPRGPRKKGILGIFVKQKMGTGEIRTGKMG